MDPRTEIAQPAELIFSRNAFYRRQYLFALGAFFLNLLVMMMLIAVVSYLHKNPPRPLYFATDNVGRLIDVPPLTQPNMSPEDISAWVIQAVESTYSYDFINYRSQLQNSQKFFTSFGWTNYINALKASNNLLALTDRKMIVLASVVEQPKLIKQGVLNNALAWKFEVPVLVTYWLPPYDDKSKFTNPLQVTVTVQRQAILQSYKGLGILQIVGTLIDTSNNAPQNISNASSG